MTHDATPLVQSVAVLSAAVCLLALAPDALAAAERSSRSIGYSLNGAGGTGPMDNRVNIGSGRSADKYLDDGVQAVKPRGTTHAAAKHTDFRIYDADAVLFVDHDIDGFYSGLDVSFDADTDHFAADVYARLYLSLEGGPWILYYTTDVFTLFGSSASDDYVVRTDLLDGYPAGYYDLLIELYDHEYHEHVASFGPYETSALAALPLEDQFADQGYVTPLVPPVSQSSGGGGGSSGVLPLAGLLLGVLLRGRPGSRGRPQGKPPGR